MKKFVLIAASLLLLTAGQQPEASSNSQQQYQIAAMYNQYARAFPQVEGITATELQQLQRQGKKLVLIDVRSPAEMAVSHLRGAVEPAYFESNLKQYQDALAIAYCTIGYRSGLYGQKLQQQGIKILNLEGSLLAWSQAGGELVNEQGTTNKIRVFGNQRRLIPKDYEPVW